MAKKIIYFVRHGETANNLNKVKQGVEGSLTEKGRAQALAAARRFPKSIGRPQIIISSPFERTRETAEIIAHELGNIKIIYSDLLKERRNPSEIIGRPLSDRAVRTIVDRMDKSFHPDDLRISDEENFMDLKARAKELLTYITHRWQKRIIMVTHSKFLKMVIAYMIYKEELTASEYNQLLYFNSIDNAGMTIVSYQSHWFKKSEWKILVWNDLI